MINEHPGVSHNYKRNHAYNLWFTIAVPPTTRLGLEKTVSCSGRWREGGEVRLLPTRKLFKIGVQLDMTGQEDMSKAKAKPAYGYEERTKAAQTVSGLRHRRHPRTAEGFVRRARPFDALAENIGVSTEELLRAGRELLERKQMRRFAAVLYHRKAGFRFNGMGVWAVPEEKADEIGMKMASFKAVSHCYLRPTYPDWPYSIFTMVHGRTKEECEAILQSIEEETGIRNGMFFIPPRNTRRRGSPISPRRWTNGRRR